MTVRDGAYDCDGHATGEGGGGWLIAEWKFSPYGAECLDARVGARAPVMVVACVRTRCVKDVSVPMSAAPFQAGVSPASPAFSLPGASALACVCACVGQMPRGGLLSAPFLLLCMVLAARVYMCIAIAVMFVLGERGSGRRAGSPGPRCCHMQQAARKWRRWDVVRYA